MKSVSVLLLVLILFSSLSMAVDIQPVKANGTIYILSDGRIDPQTALISTSDNVTYTLTGNIYDEIVVERSNILVDGSGYTLQGLGSGTGINLTGRSNVTITDMTIEAFVFGIWLSGSSNNSISGNNIANNSRGIGLWYSSNYNRISGNNITANYNGIELGNSSNYNSIFRDNIANNWMGIALYFSSNYNSISGNNITNSARGIFLNSCSNNIVSGNNITANNNVGVSLYSSSNNKFFRNNFINNAQQVYSTDSANVWNNRYMDSGGNYWSDYAGVDLLNGRYQNLTGSDGIGDAPYIIGENNTDNFPLMSPWLPAPSSPGYNETSEYLIGSVAVGVVFLESNGAINPSTENWTLEREATVVSEIKSGLSWLASNNTEANVSFVYDVNYRVPTGYEPINGPSSDLSLWISEAMVSLGYYGTSFDQVRDYINALRESRGVDWSFAIFVVDSLVDEDGCFTDPIDQTRNWSAFAYLGGPLLVMTYDNGDSGIENMDYVTTHETCHIFYATDEYDNRTETSGYLGIQDQESSGDMMEIPNTWGLCTNSQQQLGWRDSDGDGIQDIVDTFPDTLLNSYSPDPTTSSTLTYNGTVTEIPYPNNNPYGKGRDVTINVITNVEFRVDGGAWITATSADGSFDEFEESFSFTTAPLLPGTHIIEVRGINSVGNNETTYASDEVTIVVITITGDVNGDGKVNVLDAILLSNAFNSKPGDVNWNPNADFNDDGKVNILDAIILASNFGKS